MLLSIPKSENSDEFDKCKMYGVNFTEVLESNIMKPDPNWPKVPCQSGWEYDLSDIHYPSIVTEVNNLFSTFKIQKKLLIKKIFCNIILKIIYFCKKPCQLDKP